MQVTSLLSRGEEPHEHDHDHDHDHLGSHESCSVCGHDHEHTSVKVFQLAIGILFVINGYLVDWLVEQGTLVASASAMLGAIILGYPIVGTAFKDLKRGILSINELVAIAVLASFASGDYKTAGVVAFFMLVPLAITSTNSMVRRLGGKNWKWLHRLTYVAGLGGVLHYWMLVKSDTRIPLTFGFLLFVMLGYRLIAKYASPNESSPSLFPQTSKRS